MSTSTIVTRRRQQTTASTTSTASPRRFIASTTSQRTSTASTTSPRSTTLSSYLRSTSASPTALPTKLASDISFVLEDGTSTSSTTSTTIDPTTASVAPKSIETCSTDKDCAAGQICSKAKCMGMNGAAPFGGPGAGPTSQLSAGSAIGISVGVVAFVGLLIGFGFWYWRIRGRRPRTQSIEAPPMNRTRSASNATDQKTLVASLPNSPQTQGFHVHSPMPPEFFPKALAHRVGQRRPESTGAASVEKALPPAPSTENSLTPPSTEPTRYAVNVNINKSMIFDDDMVNTISSLRGNDTPRDAGTPRDRTPRYRFEEYIPPVVQPPPISISRASSTSQRGSEYELGQYPNKRSSAGTVSTTDDSSKTDSGPPSPKLGPLAKLELPELPPPSPSFSFRSYDWYQDIIGDQPSAEPPTPTVPSRNPARTSTLTTSSQPPSFSIQETDVDSSLVPEPLSPSKSAAPGLHLHPDSAALPSPTNPNFRLPPTVYTMPSRPIISPIPPVAPLRSSARMSVLSNMTRTTHNSRSWLPDEGLYLAEEDEPDTFTNFRRPSDASRPTSYSPLT